MGAEEIPPTEEDWCKAIERFCFFRYLESSDAFERAKKLPGLLESEATTIYRLADRLERTGQLDFDLEALSSIGLETRLRELGYSDEIDSCFQTVDFLIELPEQVAETPADLRVLAAFIHDAADVAQTLLDLYLDSIALIRRMSDEPTTTGAFPSVSGWWIIDATDRWGSSIATIARKLAEHHVYPDPSDVGVLTFQDLVATWEVILKKVRSRARSRGSQNEDEG